MKIELRDVHKAFGDLVVLDGVSMEVPEGETLAVLGPSGSGKSVLLKHIVGLLAADSGQVLVDGIDMGRASEVEKFAVRKRMGMLFQDGALFDSLSTGDNIAFPLEHHTSMSEAERRERVEACLEMVELPGLYDRPTSALSGGQRKRVALARAIALQPEVVFFDEPNSGLDPMTSDTIDQLIGRMKRQLGITFLVITHDIVSAMDIADTIAMLWQGELIEFCPPEVFRHSRHEVVRRFLHRNVAIPPEHELDGPVIPTLDRRTGEPYFGDG